MKPLLPLPPLSLPPDAQSAWGELVRVLNLYHGQVVTGPGVTGYAVSGTIPTSATIDLGSINVTAVAYTVVKLLNDLQSKGLVKVDKT
jgi:hypothetical protein